MKRIQLFRPNPNVEESLLLLRSVLESGWLGRGPLTEQFEREMAQVVGQKYFVATSSCTAALHLAIHCLDLPSDAVILTTPITFVSTNAAIVNNGFSPDFCDVEPRTGNISFESASTPRYVQAIILVHIGGYPCDERLYDLCVPVIEDCAHALGSKLPPARGMRCWSFHPVKNLAMGDGGGVSTDDPELAERLKRLRWMGITRDTAQRSEKSYEWEYDIPELGWKYHMNDVQGAIGLAGLKMLEADNERRKEIAIQYFQHIKVGTPPEYNFPDSSYHFLPWFFDNREEVMRRLAEANIECGHHYRRNDAYPMFGPLRNLPGVEWYDQHELTLPLHPLMSDEDVTRVIETVNACS